MSALPAAVENLVIGGGPAGAMAAMRLAEAGRSVTLIEKEHGPHDKVCGEFLSREAVAYLHQAGMLNAIGLQNIGVEEFVARKLPALARYPRCKVIVNVFGYSVSEYLGVIERLNHAEGIAAYELNVSCPNVHVGGMTFGADPGSLEYLVRQARSITQRPLIVKLSPNVTSIAHMAKVAAGAGADALSLVNTFLAMAIDVETRRPRLSNITGGLSGPAIKPIALRMVYEAAQAVSIPILGMGGIVTAEDAVEFLLAGAAAVEVGTASYADPRATERLAHSLESWCRGHHVERVSSLTRALEIPGNR